jgi:hypothetical protein
MRRIAAHAAIYLAAIALGFVMAESAYRLHLLRKDLRMVVHERTDELPVIGAYSRSLWPFDRNEGFTYVNAPIYNTHISNGRIASCTLVPPLNRYGSPGLAEGSYEDAEIKIAVFGDSFSLAVDDQNATWTTHLQRLLQAKLQRTVNVLNFARDGTGLVQMLDMAALKVREYKPDLALIAFNTDAISIPRVWRAETVINGELRVITMMKPLENPGPDSGYDTALLQPEASDEWCRQHRDGGALDRVGSDIIDKYLRFRVARYSVFTPFRSFLWHRIIHADAFYSERDHQFWARLSPGDVEQDSQLVKSIAALQDIGIPYVLVHLPIHSEVSAREEYPSVAAAQITKKISQLSGRPVHGLLEHMPNPMLDPERMSRSPQDVHPSPWGMQLYAEAVSNILLKKDLKSRSR